MYPQAQEVINRNEISSYLLKQGYGVFLPVYDRGIDFIAYREPDEFLLVQLKSRWLINKKYQGRNILLAYKDRDHWYLAPHDELVAIASRNGWLERRSWIDGGETSCAKMPKHLWEECQKYRIDS